MKELFMHKRILILLLIAGYMKFMMCSANNYFLAPISLKNFTLNSNIPENFELIESIGIKIHKGTGKIKFHTSASMLRLQCDVWAVRHGLTYGNSNKVFQGNADGEVNKLNEIGIAQAEKAAEKLFKELEEYITDGGELVILTSEISRAYDTAQKFIDYVYKITGKKLNMIKYKALNGQDFGTLKGQPFPTTKTWNLNYSAEEKNYLIRTKNFDTLAQAPQGQSYLDLLKQVFEVLNHLNKISENGQKKIIIFGHGAWLSAARVLLEDSALVDDSGYINWLKNPLENGVPALIWNNRGNINVVLKSILHDGEIKISL